jgi:hypothetical protein
VDVNCTAAELNTAFLGAEPAAGYPFSVTLTAVVSNAGSDVMGAGLPVGFYVDGERIGTGSTTGSLAPGQSESLSVLWSPVFSADYDIIIRPNDPGGGLGAQALCVAPDPAHQRLTLLDMPLMTNWNLVSTYVDPFNHDVRVVQRPIDGQYGVIMGFDQGAQSYYPDLPPALNTLHEMDALHGYWIKATSDQPDRDALDEEPWGPELWVVGEPLPEDHPIELDARWNLVSYLPRTSQPVTIALASIAGNYTAVLGFDQGALSYYPDLPPAFNTLQVMAPGHGYWIQAIASGTLVYSTTATLGSRAMGGWLSSGAESQAVRGVEEAGSGDVGEGVLRIHQAERAAGVTPTNTWMNFYGPAWDRDGASLHAGATVEAIDPDGVVCGAVSVAVEGQYGLLPCYGDDLTTPEDEGAQAGDVIRLVVNGNVLAQGAWMAHGERQRVILGGVEPGPFKLRLPLVMRAAPATDD